METLVLTQLVLPGLDGWARPVSSLLHRVGSKKAGEGGMDKKEPNKREQKRYIEDTPLWRWALAPEVLEGRVKTFAKSFCKKHTNHLGFHAVSNELYCRVLGRLHRRWERIRWHWRAVSKLDLRKYLSRALYGLIRDEKFISAVTSLPVLCRRRDGHREYFNPRLLPLTQERDGEEQELPLPDLNGDPEALLLAQEALEAQMARMGAERACVGIY